MKPTRVSLLVAVASACALSACGAERAEHVASDGGAQPTSPSTTVAVPAEMSEATVVSTLPDASQQAASPAADAPIDPRHSNVPDSLMVMLPAPLSEFAEAAEALGFDTRAIVVDGEPQVVTEDIRADRVNVVVAGGKVIAAERDGAAPSQAGADAALPGDPVGPQVPAQLTAMVPVSLDEFAEAAKSLGFDVRAAEIDGQPQALTMDYRTDRINVVLADGQVTAIFSIG